MKDGGEMIGIHKNNERNCQKKQLNEPLNFSRKNFGGGRNEMEERETT